MADERRIAKFEKAIQQEIAEALVGKLRDPRVQGIVSITRVEVSPDLSKSQIYYSLLGSDGNKRTVQRFFADSQGFFRSLIAKRLDTKTTPRLVFQYDDRAEKESRIAELLEDALADDREAQSQRGDALRDVTDENSESLDSSLGANDENS